MDFKLAFSFQNFETGDSLVDPRFVKIAAYTYVSAGVDGLEKGEYTPLSVHLCSEEELASFYEPTATT